MGEHEAVEVAPWWQRFVAAVRYVIALEPVAVASVWRALVVLLATLGVVISDATIEQGLAIIAAAYALVEVLQTIRARGRVTPTAKLDPSTRAAVAEGPLPGSAAAAIGGSSSGSQLEGDIFPQ